MDNVIRFNLKTILDNKFFWGTLWSDIYNRVSANMKHIIIDMSNVNEIKPEVLPKLCSLALACKRQGVDMEININPVSKLKNFLGDIGFFDVCQNYNIFILDEGQIGGYATSPRRKNAFLCFDAEMLKNKYAKDFAFNNGTAYSDELKYYIKAEILGIDYIFNGYITQNTIEKSPILRVLNDVCKRNDMDKDSNEFLINLCLDFVELIHNSIFHGESICFFALQSGKYKANTPDEFERTDICVSDAGRGLYESLINKDWGRNRKTMHSLSYDKMKSLKNKYEQNYYAILEMIYYRENDNRKGVYDVLNNIDARKLSNITIVNKSTSINLKKDDKGKIDTIKDILNSKDIRDKAFIRNYNLIDYGFSFDSTFNL